MATDSRITEQLRSFALPIENLNHDPANARRHGLRSIEGLKRRLTTEGQLKPIVVQKAGMIVRAGNGVLQAARELGWPDIACVVVEMDDATATRFALADNQVATFSEWDDSVLATLLESLSRDDRMAVGFDDVEFGAVLDKLAKDDAPPVPADGGGDPAPPQPDEQVQESPPNSDSPPAAAGHKLRACCPNCNHVFEVTRDA
jgi:hypothetical protein